MYDIRAGALAAKRRYSEFEALRAALTTLHPTVIVPPLPHKHQLRDYALKQSRAKDDPALLAHRRRTLERFLTRVDATPALHDDPVFVRFLDARFSWHEIQSSPPLAYAPKNNLAAPPHCPADPDAPAAYAALPVPRAPRTLRVPNARFRDSDEFTRRFGSHMDTAVERCNRRLMRRWADLAADYADLGAVLNGLSLTGGDAAAGIERAGQATDATYIAANHMLAQWTAAVYEPLHEYTQYAGILQHIITWRHLKHQQLESAQEMLAGKRAELARLERIEADKERLSRALAGEELLVPPARRSVYAEAAEGEEPERAAGGEDAERAAGKQAERAAGGEDAERAALYAPPAPSTLLSSLRHTFHHVMDVDPDKTRQSSISRLREEVLLLDEGVRLCMRDVAYVTDEIQASLNRFQRNKVSDMRRILAAYARIHRDYCVQGRDAWANARSALGAVGPDAWGGMPDAALPPRTRAPADN